MDRLRNQYLRKITGEVITIKELAEEQELLNRKHEEIKKILTNGAKVSQNLETSELRVKH